MPYCFYIVKVNAAKTLQLFIPHCTSVINSIVEGMLTCISIAYIVQSSCSTRVVCLVCNVVKFH